MEEAGGRGGRWCDDAGEGSRSSGPAGHARKNKASQLHVFARRRRHAHGGELQEATDGLTVAVRGRLASRLKALPHTSPSAGAPAVSACSGPVVRVVVGGVRQRRRPGVVRALAGGGEGDELHDNASELGGDDGVLLSRARRGAEYPAEVPDLLFQERQVRPQHRPVSWPPPPPCLSRSHGGMREKKARGYC